MDGRRKSIHQQPCKNDNRKVQPVLSCTLSLLVAPQAVKPGKCLRNLSHEDWLLYNGPENPDPAGLLQYESHPLHRTDGNERGKITTERHFSTKVRMDW